MNYVFQINKNGELQIRKYVDYILSTPSALNCKYVQAAEEAADVCKIFALNYPAE